MIVYVMYKHNNNKFTISQYEYITMAMDIFYIIFYIIVYHVS